MDRLKRYLIMFIMVLIFSVPAFSAPAYNFYLSLSTAPQLVIAKNDPCPVRTSITATADIGFISMKLAPEHTVSLPISIAWSSTTSTKAVVVVHDHWDLTAQLSYEYTFSRLMSLRAALGGGFSIYPDVSGWAPIYCAATLEFVVNPAKDFAVTFPVRCYVEQSAVDVNFGVGISFWMDFDNPTAAGDLV